MNAYELADEIEAKYHMMGFQEEAVVTLRQQADLLKKYEKRNVELQTKITKLLTQTKPLSDEEIGDCVDDYFGLMALQHKYIYDIDQIQEYGLKLARAIEERHGIK